MKPGQKIDLGMTGYAELFMSDEERRTQTLPRIVDIPIELVDDFPDHPFKVRMDEDMQQLVESIRERGMITPVILRKKEDGRYEIVSGHRRKKACEIAGLKTIKAEVREMTRDEAIIMMVESNLHRSVILPSEKAFSYKMRLEAIKSQRQKTDLSSVPMAQKAKTSREQLGEIVGESQDNVRRYIRLTELIPELLERVDKNQIALRPAVELSYLTKEEQKLVNEKISEFDCTPSHDQAIRMRKDSGNGILTPEKIEEIIREIKPNQKEKVHIDLDKIRAIIPNMPIDKAETIILQALEHYRKHCITPKPPTR